jgi:hypothetical protein
VAGRRRSRGSNSIASVIPDVVHTASRLPWWGALLTGIAAYVVIAVWLGGFVESQIAKQQGSMYAGIVEARLGYMVRACNWVGLACLIAGIFFAVRNFFVSARSSQGENRLVSLVSTILGRSLD